jgi:hypothetical protein
MKATQDLVQRFDEDNKLLGDPIQLPPELDKATNTSRPPANLFLRPPRGVADKVGQGRAGGLPYRYPASQTGAVVTAVELALGKGDEDLAAKVPGWFPSAPALQRFEVPPQTFLAAEFDYDAKNACSVYVTPMQKGQTQVALVYWLDGARKDSARAAVNRSLESLAVGAAALARREKYGWRSPWKPGGR